MTEQPALLPVSTGSELALLREARGLGLDDVAERQQCQCQKVGDRGGEEQHRAADLHRHLLGAADADDAAREQDDDEGDVDGRRDGGREVEGEEEEETEERFLGLSRGIIARW